MTRRVITDKQYRATILFLADCEAEDARTKAEAWFIQRRVTPLVEWDSLDAKGITYQATDNHFMVWVKSKRDLPTLVHEAYHLTTAVMGYIGHEVNEETDEPPAYFIELMFSEMTA